ncbi:tyrosine-type recombinase/integrase [Mycobacteroides abscessus]|uniref:tyrosine-type recombinase/integrase n=1 Tax=Mycobacteroides abscessus TaxID=36809 RepID=UPI0009CA848B|nr:site-specific integrase [Mycobacteroides abscessus subsp. massiliense]SKK23511.1 site-specific recombinase XerD [Mycobacteroides abscessus subsp. massiliense]SKW74106.1 site-specific recombinase XerD [Mycobacteroides abscessus subsp. massiliense]
MTGRRSTGEGTVYLRKDGRWEAAAYLPTVSGGRRRIRVYGKTRSDAQSQLTAKLAAAAKGIAVSDRSWTVGTYLDYWMRDVAPMTLRPRTIELYDAVVRNHLKPRLGSQSLTELSVTTLQRILNKQLSEGSSARTVGVTRTVLSAALTRAMREDIVQRNVARLVTLPAWERADITPWTTAETTRFLVAARRERLYPAFLLLALYGMRRGEVLGLRWSDVDWEHNQIHVRQQLQQIGGKLDVGPVKTNAGKRDLPLLEPVRDALNRLQALSEGIDTESDLVFLSEEGTPLWPRNFVRLFQHIRERVGLRRIKLHHLRHTAATLLKNLGVPARDAQLILGHAHITTTQQIYQHGDVTAQQTALDRVGRALLESADDSGRSRQNQPSTAEFVVINTSFQSGGPGGNRTLDTLLKRPILLDRNGPLTSVIAQLRAHTNSHVLGVVAVRSSRQNGQPRGQP